ncbi:MAG: hypothetical protein HQ526_04075 [Actinobacteria bacterium]|nr:hypothetical protein [Actinomycetota bacterium]
MTTRGHLRTTKGFTLAASIPLGAIILSGCSQITESETVSNAKNKALCSVISQPLQALDENISNLSESQAGQAAGSAVVSAQSALDSATSTASGQLAVALSGLDDSIQSLLSALSAGAGSAELKQLTKGVQTNIGNVQADCAS